MQRVRILKPIYIEQTGLRYRAGEEVDVPKDIAERHFETGFMDALVPEIKETKESSKPKNISK